MRLNKCKNDAELISFLKQDYVNNLYFFTYLNDITNSADNQFLVGKWRDKIVLVLLITPIHCCISAVHPRYIYAVDQLPPIQSIHVVGRQDLVEGLLKLSAGPKRDQHIYSFGELALGAEPGKQHTASRKASPSDLHDLIEFYGRNDMLIGAENRLPGILSWGTIYFVEQDRKIISCALTTTETDDTAMIGAVFTLPEYRRYGYARDCIISLSKELAANHKKPYLFYQTDNLWLRQFYKSLGFVQTSTWLLASRC